MDISVLYERARDRVLDRIDQVIEERALAGIDQYLRRHPGDFRSGGESAVVRRGEFQERRPQPFQVLLPKGPLRRFRFRDRQVGPNRLRDMVRGDCLFSATGVTDGSMLRGVKFRGEVIETETVVMRSVTGTVRLIRAEHRQLEKFHLG